MAQIVSRLSESKAIGTLDTYNMTIVTAGIYTVQLAITEVPVSGCSITIQQNGSTKASAATLSSQQQELDCRVILNCAAGDVLSTIVASSALSDNTPNHVKGILNIRQGVS